MSYQTIDLSIRESKKVTSPTKLRREGWIPGVVYGKGVNSISVKIPVQKLESYLKGGEAIVEASIDGKKKELVNLTGFERDILTRKLKHFAFYILQRGQKSTFTVPIQLVGDAPGVKEGGIVTQVLNEIDVECLPQDAPSAIELDISGLGFEENITLENLKLPAKVELIEEKLDETIVTCKPPKKEKVSEETTAPAEVEATAQGPSDDAKPAEGGGDAKAENKEDKK